MTFSKEDLESELARLNRQLISCKIIDRQGIYRGVVKDIYFDVNNQVNLLVELTKNNNKLNLRRLAATDIRQIDLEHKSVFINLSEGELESLPLYQPVPTHLKEASKETSYSDGQINTADDTIEQRSNPQEYHISLLEEKLQVNRRKQKVGEVVVRKQIETRMVQVPIRREKLIVERMGKNPELLTEVVIGEEKVNGFQYQELSDNSSLHITKSHFIKLQTAQALLEALANLSSAERAKVRIEIVTDSSQDQIQHQGLCDRYL